MAALSAVAPVLNKAPVVSTGKAANTNSHDGVAAPRQQVRALPPPSPVIAISGFFSSCGFFLSLVRSVSEPAAAARLEEIRRRSRAGISSVRRRS